MLSDEHPTSIKHVATQGPVVTNNLALVPRDEVLFSTQFVRTPVKINPQYGRNFCPDEDRLFWSRREGPAAIEKVQTASCLDPGMSCGACCTSTATHSQHATSIGWASCQTGHGHDASPVRSRGMDAMFIDADGVYRTQALGTIGATP